jgi:hypothetical protein
MRYISVALDFIGLCVGYVGLLAYWKLKRLWNYLNHTEEGGSFLMILVLCVGMLLPAIFVLRVGACVGPMGCE